MMHFAKAEKYAVVTGKGCCKWPLWLLDGYEGTYCYFTFVKGQLSCPHYLAPEIIAVNPIIEAWVCAFQEREII